MIPKPIQHHAVVNLLLTQDLALDWSINLPLLAQSCTDSIAMDNSPVFLVLPTQGDTSSVPADPTEIDASSATILPVYASNVMPSSVPAHPMENDMSFVPVDPVYTIPVLPSLSRDDASAVSSRGLSSFLIDPISVQP